MAANRNALEKLIGRTYTAGFVTEVEEDSLPPGLNEDIIRILSAKKGEPEWMLEWRLNAFRHWLKMEEPHHWAQIQYHPVDYQAISYYAAPKSPKASPKSLEEVDPKLLETFEKLGIPLHERQRLAGVAVDAVFDSVSVATTFKETLAKAGVIFCPMSEAIRTYPELVRQYLGSVVPPSDNFFAALNSAVFSDGSFVYVPKGVRCPMELSTYFRINAAKTGQFERTLIIADEGAYVSYLEGCLPAWEEVSCGDTLRPIAEIGLHETVLSAEGQEADVRKLMRRPYCGDLVEITPISAGNAFQVTPEHPVLAIRREQVQSSLRGPSRLPDIDRTQLSHTEPVFVPAGELQAGDLLVFPVNQVVRDVPELSDDFLRLLGYYLAVGCGTQSNGDDAVEFAFSLQDEQNIASVIALIERVTGMRPSVTLDRKRNRAYVVVDSGKLWQLCIEHGGQYAHSKRLSKAVMDLPPQRQRLVLDAYYRGNGNIRTNGKLTQVRATTLSRQLAFQLQELWARQGIYACLNVREASERRQEGSGCHKRYVLSHTLGKGNAQVKYRDGYFLVPIRRVVHKPFVGEVFNLETSGSHTYLVKGFATHNCTAPQRSEHQLHAAVVELIALAGATIKYSTVQNWYPGDEEGRGGIYNFVTKRGECRGDRAKISWTQVETGSAITWKYPSCILRGDGSVGEFYSVAVTNHFQQADTGTKMIHIGRNTKSTIISKGISAGRAQNSYRGLVKVLKSAVGARNYTQCDSLLIGDRCGAHTFPYIEVKQPGAVVEHEATTSKISEEQLFYCRQRGISAEDAVSMIVNGFCKAVFKELPMEFAVEAQNLLGVSLEGSVG